MEKKEKSLLTFLIIILLLYVPFCVFAGIRYFSNSNDKQSEINNDEKNDDETNDNNKNQPNEFATDVIMEKIEKIKKEVSLTDIQKAENIINLIYKEHFNVISGTDAKFICKLDEDEYATAPEIRYICEYDGYGVIFKKDFSSMREDREIVLSDDYVEEEFVGWNLEQFLNYLRFSAYKSNLNQKLKTAGFDFYDDRIYNKYNLTDKNRCLGYTDSTDYFYINVNEVNGPKLGWYYSDETTGECAYMVRQAFQFKIDKKTYGYEIVENK